MNHNDREVCRVNDALLWILCKLVEENKAMLQELKECYSRIDALSQQLQK